MKKIMLLGGNYFQMTATLAAKRLGYYVVSVDYLPDNPAHQYADAYYNISTVDREKVLEKARELQIDGIVSYASDISAPTAAYVAEQLGLPTNPYESVWTLTHKNLFRDFLRANDFNVPEGKSFLQTEFEEAKDYYLGLQKHVIVKPVDSSGSKGVSFVDDEEKFAAAWAEALSYSLSKRVIVEEFIQKSGYQIDGDFFVVDGEIRFWGICDQHHDLGCSRYAPVAHSFPSIQDQKYQEKAREELQRLLNLLHMHMGAYNAEYIVTPDGEVYLMELGPRNGGNLITDALAAATGVDLAAYTVRQAVGESCEDLYLPSEYTCASSYVLHSQKEGVFQELYVSPEIRGSIVRQDVLVKKGEKIHPFRNGSFGIGAMILTFDNVRDMCRKIDNLYQYVYPIISN